MSNPLSTKLNKLNHKLVQIIAHLPTNRLRIAGYKLIFGYDIQSSKIGFGTKIFCQKVILKNAEIGGENDIKSGVLEIVGGKIGNSNTFTNLKSIVLEEDASISSFNTFLKPISLKLLAHASIGNCNTVRGSGKLGKVELKCRAHITSSHFFDVGADITIGESTVIAGRETQFWTHGAGIHKSIEIGNHCYIGSASRFAPGAKIGNNILVGLGSVVTKEFDGDRAMIAGVPAKIIKTNYDFRDKYNFDEKES